MSEGNERQDRVEIEGIVEAQLPSGLYRVEIDGSRALVPSCSRPVEADMVVHTDTERTRHSRRMVLEFLASTTDLSIAPGVAEWIGEYGAQPERFGERAHVREPLAGRFLERAQDDQLEVWRQRGTKLRRRDRRLG